MTRVKFFAFICYWVLTLLLSDLEVHSDGADPDVTSAITKVSTSNNLKHALDPAHPSCGNPPGIQKHFETLKDLSTSGGEYDRFQKCKLENLTSSKIVDLFKSWGEFIDSHNNRAELGRLKSNLKRNSEKYPEVMDEIIKKLGDKKSITDLSNSFAICNDKGEILSIGIASIYRQSQKIYLEYLIGSPVSTGGGSQAIKFLQKIVNDHENLEKIEVEAERPTFGFYIKFGFSKSNPSLRSKDMIWQKPVL